MVSADGMVCLSGLRKSIMLPQKRDKPQIAHHFPSHAVAVLPWMAPEILQQVRAQRERGRVSPPLTALKPVTLVEYMS